jgi:hypothetical protein
MGACNCLQQSECHSYWLNYTTNWIHPLHELPFTGGFDNFGEPGRAARRRDRKRHDRARLKPLGVHNDPRIYGDNPNRPRDPDLFDAEDDAREFRQRFIPSGLANEILWMSTCAGLPSCRMSTT